MQHLVIHIRD